MPYTFGGGFAALLSELLVVERVGRIVCAEEIVIAACRLRSRRRCGAGESERVSPHRNSCQRAV